MNKENKRPYVMSVAGFDPSGGAGLLADIKCFEQHRVYGFGACTALTVQSDDTFLSCRWLSAEEIIGQIRVLTDKFKVSACKIGLIQDVSSLLKVLRCLRESNAQMQIVLDPVLKSSSGFSFHEWDLEALKPVLEHLDLICPNYPEMMKMGLVKTHPEAADLARNWSAYCPVLLKGGHRSDRPGTDLLFVDGEMRVISGKMEALPPKHGSGCVLSSAVTSGLALGKTLFQACLEAKDYVEAFLSSDEGLLGHHNEFVVRSLPGRRPISRLHYISQSPPQGSHLESIRAVLEAGGKWIQLRVKQQTAQETLELAIRARELCEAYGAVLIVNDFPEIARQAGAHGVHLGLSDMPLRQAREILGPDMIIGGTANTFGDILQRVEEGADYIGLGPFRFTKTKAVLSPVIGLEGYHKLMNQVADAGIRTPIVAIGGLLKEDIAGLIDCGVHGVAVSGALTGQPDIQGMLSDMNRQLSGLCQEQAP